MYAGVTITDGQEENTILMISKRSRKLFYLCIFTYTRPEFGVRQEVSASDSDETPLYTGQPEIMLSFRTRTICRQTNHSLSTFKSCCEFISCEYQNKTRNNVD